MRMRKIIVHAGMEYSLWLSNPRMSILLVLLALIHTMDIQPLAQAGGQIGGPVPPAGAPGRPVQFYADPADPARWIPGSDG